MIRKFLNRLIGRKDSNIGAINAYVEGNASEDDVKLVEKLMSENPALEKDLATQKALVSVLGKIARTEAPRSFAITPEMVAAVEASESTISKLAELFAPQRKLALAPMALAGFAALTVALLTLGDVTGVVEQSGRGQQFSTTAASSAAQPDSVETLAAPALAGAADAPQIEMASGPVQGDGSSEATGGGLTELEESTTTQQTSTPAPALVMPATADTADEVAPETELSTFGDDADEDALDARKAQTTLPAATAETSLEFATEDEPLSREPSATGDAIESEGPSDFIAPEADGAAVPFDELDTRFTEPPDADNRIALPLWQLQIALAALAVAAIGLWVGLRRVRRD